MRSSQPGRAQLAGPVRYMRAGTSRLRMTRASTGRGRDDLAALKTHVSRLLMKLDAHDRAQLVMIAYETRLVTPA